MKPPSSIQITALGSYAPPKVVTNTDLSHLVDTSDQWIQSHTGIQERHIAEADQSTCDMAYLSVEDLLKTFTRKASEID